MARQGIVIYSQNIVGCLEFFMGHPGFRYDQTYEPSHIYNKNDQRVYNKIYIGKW